MNILPPFWVDLYRNSYKIRFYDAIIVFLGIA